MDKILNLQSTDLFEPTRSRNEKIHIRVQMRTTRKSITIMENMLLFLSIDDIKTFLKNIKKTHGCNGNILKDKDKNTIVQFQGDQRQNTSSLLEEKYGVNKDNIVIHGF